MVGVCVQKSGPGSRADTGALKPSPSTSTARSTSSRKLLFLRAKNGVVSRIYLLEANVKNLRATGSAAILASRRSGAEEEEGSNLGILVHQELDH